MEGFSITHAAHAEFRVTDLEHARAFYVKALAADRPPCIRDLMG